MSFTTTKYYLIRRVFAKVTGVFFCCTPFLLLAANPLMAQQEHETNDFCYDLSRPVRTLLLDDELDEISGIAVMGDAIYAIQDEKAHIYKLDMNGKIRKEHDFGKNADFEDITIAGGRFFVLRSDGVIFETGKLKKKDVDSEKHKTPLNKSNDAEGLCYDPVSGSLLIACKGYAGLKPGQTGPHYRAVYRFDLLEHKLDNKPWLLIPLDSLQNEKESSYFENLSIRIASFLHESGDIRFQPSAIALHPFTNETWILSANSYCLLVLRRDGKILHYIKIDKSLLPQAEGLSFDEWGRLFISSEADGKTARILIFEPKQASGNEK